MSRPQGSVTLRRRSLPLVVGLLVILQVILPYRGWILLLFALAGAWLLGYLWARSLARSLGLRREIRSAWTHVGDEMLERFSLANPGWAPAPWVELVDHSTLPGHRASRVVYLGSHDLLGWHQATVCSQRGLFNLGPASLRSGDPLAIYAVEVHQPASTLLMVMPPVVPLPGIQVAAGGRVGDGRPRVHALERTVSSAGVRGYLPGDSLRWIHWPTTARLDSPYIRLFDNTPSGDRWIVLDMDQRVQAGEGQASTQEHGVVLAASLADRAIQRGRAVGLVTLGGQEDLIWLPPRSDRGQRWEILRGLAVAATGPTSLSDLLAQVRPALGQAASLILITPAAHGRWLETLLPLVRRGVVPTVLLLDATSFGAPGDPRATGRLLAELGIRHHLIHRDFLEGWQPRPRKPARGRLGRLRDDPWKVLA